jgi:glycosyltransferase involved in cell wall biosynthesis
MKYSNITKSNTVFVLVSFEGPDCYSMAGGLGVRMQHLSRALAETGFTTHLFYIGDPQLPGEEIQEDGHLILHRWCQWISQFHPGGVYAGEDGKLADFTSSLPPYIVEKIVKPAAAKDKIVVILGEEWQTAEAMCRLSDLLFFNQLRDKAILFWNANNIFSFHLINWGRLNYATTITTISRYMKHIMERMGLNPLVIPNGIPTMLLRKVDDRLAMELRSVLEGRLVLCKIARWDPDKNWIGAIEATARLKELGLKPVLLARGGVEPYGQEVISRALSLQLTVKEARMVPEERNGYLTALADAMPADVIDIRFQLPLDILAIMYRASDAVLANSGHEPFGIVGLEAMAAGGIVFTGSTGEDYSIPFVNSFMIETPNPMEIVSYITYLRNYPQQVERMRNSARTTARYYTWEAAIQNLIGKLENQGRIQGTLDNLSVNPDSITPPASLMIAQRVWQTPSEGSDGEELRNIRCLS